MARKHLGVCKQRDRILGTAGSGRCAIGDYGADVTSSKSITIAKQKTKPQRHREIFRKDGQTSVLFYFKEYTSETSEKLSSNVIAPKGSLCDETFFVEAILFLCYLKEIASSLRSSQ